MYLHLFKFPEDTGCWSIIITAQESLYSNIIFGEKNEP